MSSFVRKTPARVAPRTITLGNGIAPRGTKSKGDTRLPSGWWLIPACLLGAAGWVLIFHAIGGLL
jgi:hypothetical protein